MYKNILCILSVASMALFGQNAYAKELSLDEALGYAIERNEDIDIAELKITQSDFIVREAESSLYPTITATGQYLLNQTYTHPYKMPSNGDTVFNAGIGVEVNQLLFAFGMIENAIETAELAQKLMYTQKDIATNALRYAIRNAYFAALMYEENYKIAQQSYRNALNTKSRLESAASVRMSQSDLIKVDADIASRKPTVDSAKLSLEKSYRLLEVLCVLDEPITKLSSQFDDLPIIDFTLEAAIAQLPNSPTIKMLEQQVGYSMKLAEVRRDSTNPTIGLRASYTFGETSEHMHLPKGHTSGEGILGVFISIPLYDGGKAEAQAMQEEYNARITRKELMQTTRELENSLKDAYETYTTNLEVLKMDDQAIRLANRSYEQSLDRFLNGQASAVELNDVESGLTLLKQKRIVTIHGIYASLAQIEQIVGDL